MTLPGKLLMQVSCPAFIEISVYILTVDPDTQLYISMRETGLSSRC
jgi:hypothetical protein